ncbi:MAG: NAD-dependent epimerase/dehydratase family protein [Lewinellaceae bacterium]|nr:NAD-dependent epimerase/dehydratase family protein [Lewinellaceae bacterium]
MLVTGAGGMLGSHIVEILAQDGYRIKVLLFPGSPANDLSNLPVEYCYGDIRDPELCAEAMRDCQMVLHTAASISTWPTRSKTAWDINLAGTQNLVQAAIHAGIQRFVHIGTASAFGPGDNGQAATEETPFRGNKYQLDYVDSKYAAHQFVLQTARQQGFPAVIVCPTFMIGPNDVSLGTGQIIIAMCTGKLRFLSGGGKNFVYVRDVAQAAVNALKQGRTGEAYIAGHQNLTYRQYFDLVSAIIQAPAPRILMPDRLILIAGMLSSALAKLLRYRPMLNHAQARVSIDKQFYNPAKAIAELGMPQTDIRVAIGAAFDWLRREKYC